MIIQHVPNVNKALLAQIAAHVKLVTQLPQTVHFVIKVIIMIQMEFVQFVVKIVSIALTEHHVLNVKMGIKVPTAATVPLVTLIMPQFALYVQT